MQTLDSHPKSHNYSQVIVHDGVARGHTAVLDTGSQQSIFSIGGWGIIRIRDTWIDKQGINMGGSSKSGRHLQLVYARGVVKNCLDGKC